LSIFSGKRARQAYVAGEKKLGDAMIESMGQINTGFDQASTNFNQAAAGFDAFGNQFKPGAQIYLDSLGVNGAEGNARAVDSFRAGPGYRFAVDQALDGVNRHAAATGMTASGNTLAALNDRAVGMANQEYGNWQTRLGTLPQLQLAGLTGAAGARTGLGTLAYNRGRDLASLITDKTDKDVGLHNAAMKAGDQADANKFGAIMGGIDLGLKALGSIAGLPTAGGGSVGAKFLGF
jgi:hypothetical protein